MDRFLLEPHENRLILHRKKKSRETSNERDEKEKFLWRHTIDKMKLTKILIFSISFDPPHTIHFDFICNKCKKLTLMMMTKLRVKRNQQITIQSEKFKNSKIFKWEWTCPDQTAMMMMMMKFHKNQLPLSLELGVTRPSYNLHNCEGGKKVRIVEGSTPKSKKNRFERPSRVMISLRGCKRSLLDVKISIW